jgi:hypothetical protein
MAFYGTLDGLTSPSLVCATTLDYWKQSAGDPTANCGVIPGYTYLDDYSLPYANYSPYYLGGWGFGGRGIGLGGWRTGIRTGGWRGGRGFGGRRR